MVEFLSDEVRARTLVSLFPTFFTDYVSALGSNWHIHVCSLVKGLPLCPVCTEEKYMGWVVEVTIYLQFL